MSESSVPYAVKRRKQEVPSIAPDICSELRINPTGHGSRPRVNPGGLERSIAEVEVKYKSDVSILGKLAI
ncbi:MAG: hypothetical protein H6Q41_2920 [Deltaproteobacteria bacterium]|nr:hypothetical protein [Deltaproteobacteria bacterium]